MCYRGFKACAGLALLIVFLGCGHSSFVKIIPTPRSSIGHWQLREDPDSFKIPIDQSTRSTTYMLNDEFVLGDSAFLAVVQQNKNVINIYNLGSKTLSKRIQLHFDGENGIGNFYVSHFVSYDSILVRGSDNHKLYMVDSAGVVKRTLNLRLDGINKNRVVYFTPNGKPLLLGDKVFGLLLPDVDVRENAFRLDELPFFVYDLKGGSTGPELIKSIRFPKVLDQVGAHWGIFNFEPSFCAFKGKVAYAFPALDSIYVFDLNTQKVVAHGVPSVEGFVPPEPLGAWEDGLLVKLAKSEYMNYLLRYDPYQDVFYRFVFHPVEEDLNYTDYYRAMADKPITVQIIDGKDFSVRGETRLRAKQFYFQDTFVGKDGLFISNNSPSKKNKNEDFISYTRFTIAK